ncbi:MAG: restriction endonuclease subunit S [Campylobacterales bacterium]|nr:restriction endonuclease subunit S [Campylobacterales bacterium]
MKADWINCNFEDILTLKNGFAFKSDKYSENGTPVIRISDINDAIVKTTNAKKVQDEENYENYLVEFGDILIAMSGATTGKFGIYKEQNKAYQNQRVGNFKLHCEELINKNYIYYLLYALRRQIEKDAYGGAQPNISSKKIEAMQITLAPLLEQKAIVAKIEQLFSELDNAVANLKTAKAKLKIYRQAVLKKAFTKETPDGRFEGELISNLTTKVGSGATPKGGKNVYKDSGIPLIRSMNVHFDKIKYDEMAYIDDEQAKKLDNVEVKENDVLLNITGASIGRVNIAPENLDGARVNQHVSILRLKQELMFPKFLKYYIESPDLQNWITKENYGTTRQALTKSMILNMLIPCPSFEEQNQIVQEIESRLSVCDKIEETIETSLAKSEALRQSILKKAFEGKLLSEQELENIKNHPEYESAEALLKRIKKERTK